MDALTHYIAIELAAALNHNLLDRVQADLTAMDEVLLSGEHSVLSNCWEEVCVQMQQEQSIYWDAYCETIEALIDAYLEELSFAQTVALWFYTDPDTDEIAAFEEQLHGDKSRLTIDIAMLKEWLLDRLLERAADYHNARIERYLCRFDDDCDEGFDEDCDEDEYDEDDCEEDELWEEESDHNPEDDDDFITNDEVEHTADAADKITDTQAAPNQSETHAITPLYQALSKLAVPYFGRTLVELDVNNNPALGGSGEVEEEDSFVPAAYDFSDINQRTEALIALYHGGYSYLMAVTQLLWQSLPEPREQRADWLCRSLGVAGSGKQGLYLLLANFIAAADDACQQLDAQFEAEKRAAVTAVDPFEKYSAEFAQFDAAIAYVAKGVSDLIALATSRY